MSSRVLEYERDGLPASLRRAVQLLREEPEPDSHWQHRVMRGVASSARPRAFAGWWTMRPITAIAAGLACALLGGAATAVLTRAPDVAPPPVASVSAPHVRFTLDAPGATSVALVGDFNGWNPQALPMRRSRDGQTWEVEVPLAPGRYTYSFIVDGVLARDPRAPRALDDDFGAPSSVVLVRGS
jgi:Carbohydrate-binding module 48 (Isoamylase N-terminal domain)